MAIEYPGTNSMSFALATSLLIRLLLLLLLIDLASTARSFSPAANVVVDTSVKVYYKAKFRDFGDCITVMADGNEIPFCNNKTEGFIDLGMPMQGWGNLHWVYVLLWHLSDPVNPDFVGKAAFQFDCIDGEEKMSPSEFLRRCQAVPVDPGVELDYIRHPWWPDLPYVGPWAADSVVHVVAQHHVVVSANAQSHDVPRELQVRTNIEVSCDRIVLGSVSSNPVVVVPSSPVMQETVSIIGQKCGVYFGNNSTVMPLPSVDGQSVNKKISGVVIIGHSHRIATWIKQTYVKHRDAVFRIPNAENDENPVISADEIVYMEPNKYIFPVSSNRDSNILKYYVLDRSDCDRLKIGGQAEIFKEILGDATFVKNVKDIILQKDAMTKKTVVVIGVNEDNNLVHLAERTNAQVIVEIGWFCRGRATCREFESSIVVVGNGMHVVWLGETLGGSGQQSRMIILNNQDFHKIIGIIMINNKKQV